MKLAEYRQFVRDYDLYPHTTARSVQLGLHALGLVGEAGEVAEKIKKSYRDDTPLPVEAIAKELGDVAWYLTKLADDLGYGLDEIITMNVQKLSDRKRRGVDRGSGDDR